MMRPRTSWLSVFVGWLAGVGALTIVLPLALIGTALSPAIPRGVDDPLLALPIVGAIFVAALVAGYAAGRMAGQRRSWHGLLSALWGVLVAMVAALGVAQLAETSELPNWLARPDIVTFADAYAFGSVMSLVVAVLGGWLGGLLAPAPPPVAVSAAAPASSPRQPSLFERIVRRRDRADLASEQRPVP